MESDILVGIGFIIVLGVGLQWLARLLHFPSIVLLLAGGLVVGPWLGLVDSDKILGDALFPVVSLSVGILLFLGGLELRVSELGPAIRRPVTWLVTVGVLITWVLATVAAVLFFDEPLRVAVVLGAILVVSGPTVVIPLLRLARPRGSVATILTWEGIVVDPIGSALSVFCFNAVFVRHFTLGEIWSEFIVVALAGIAAGLVAAVLLVAALRRLLVPADLEVAVTVMFVVAAYVAAENVRPEAGLFATTTMGIVLANQHFVALRSLRIFGDPILTLLIGSLFIVLASRVEPGSIVDHLPGILGLALVLVLIVRPLVAATCTIGASSMTPRERAFLACMAPRGIVAAATASFFSLRLEQLGQPSEMLVPVTFAIIILLALLYGLGARPATRLLRLERPRARGLLLVSSSPWAVGLAREMQRAGVPTVLVARGSWDLAARPDLDFTVFAGLVRDLPDSGLLDDVRHAVVASTDDEIEPHRRPGAGGGARREARVPAVERGVGASRSERARRRGVDAAAVLARCQPGRSRADHGRGQRRAHGGGGRAAGRRAGAGRRGSRWRVDDEPPPLTFPGCPARRRPSARTGRPPDLRRDRRRDRRRRPLTTILDVRGLSAGPRS